MFRPKTRTLSDGYVEVIVNPAQIWKASVNMIYWPMMTRIRSFLELHRFRLVSGGDDETLVIDDESGKFEIRVPEQLSFGRGSRRVAIVMGPFTSETSSKVVELKQQIPDLFVKGKKINWQGPEDLRGWWD